MAVAFVQEFAIGNRSTENYDWVAERFIGEHLASLSPDDFPNPTTAAEEPSRQGFYELHNVVRGSA
jgi:hypothetical protein